MRVCGPAAAGLKKLACGVSNRLCRTTEDSRSLLFSRYFASWHKALGSTVGGCLYHWVDTRLGLCSGLRVTHFSWLVCSQAPSGGTFGTPCPQLAFTAQEPLCNLLAPGDQPTVWTGCAKKYIYIYTYILNDILAQSCFQKQQCYMFWAWDIMGSGRDCRSALLLVWSWLPLATFFCTLQ